MKIKMLTSQSGPEISRQYGIEYDLENVEAVRLVRSGQAEALDQQEYQKALKALEEDEAKEIESRKNLATTKLGDAEIELLGLVDDINDAKAKLAEAKENADKIIRKHSDKGKEIVKLQAVVDAEIREKARLEQEAIDKVAAAEKKTANKSKSGGGSKKKTTPEANKPKTISQMNKGELQAEVAKLEGIKAEEIERVNKLGNKGIKKYLNAYKAPKTSSDDSTKENKPPEATTAKK